jgi:hypothetical protein
VLVGVAGGGQRAQGKAAEVHLVAVGQRGVREGSVAGGGGEYGGAVVGGQLHRTGQEVGVQVGVGGEGHREAASVGGCTQCPQIATRIDGQGPSAAEVDEVGAVAQTLIDQRYQVIVGEAHRILQGVPSGAGRLSAHP